jgi:hypothetical protein
MNAHETVPVLNRLFRMLCRSLPAYLADAKTGGWPDRESIRAAVERLAADQRMYAERVAEAITARGGRPDPGGFPTEFAAKNDLSLAFLLREVVASQREETAAIGQCVGQLEGESALHALAEEILGNAKGHLEILAEMMEGRD